METQYLQNKTGNMERHELGHTSMTKREGVREGEGHRGEKHKENKDR